jgi:1-acyl-sn-glycerol-3-phosphate acyltransferase
MFTAAKKAIKTFLLDARAARRAGEALVAAPVIGALVVAQDKFVGPVLHNDTVIPRLFAKTMCHILGYKVVFNKASAPIVKEKGTQVLFTPNHQSDADPLVIRSVIDAAFVGKAELMDVPVVRDILRIGHFIPVCRKSEFNAESRGRIVENLNAGRNVLMFPEGTTSATRWVKQFRAALPKFIYGGEDGKAVDDQGQSIALEKNVVIQPVAIVVKSINGHTAGTGQSDAENQKVRDLYNKMGGGHGRFGKIMKLLQTKAIVEVTVFPALKPDAFPDAEKLLTQAALNVASVFHPGQTEFRQSKLPVIPALQDHHF